MARVKPSEDTNSALRAEKNAFTEFIETSSDYGFSSIIAGENGLSATEKW
jgi:hypothetical protein